MKKIIVTGANGQLGRELQEAAKLYASSFEFIFLGREGAAIDDAEKVSEIFSTVQPYACINCAAYTAVDKAESEQEKAFAVNGAAVGILAAACKAVAARFVHVSTDYVFDGQSATPLKESDRTGPINVYGASKLQGEQLAMQNNPETVIIRTAWVYSEFGNNFVKTMIRLMKEKPSLSVVADQIGSPTYAADLARAILHILSADRFVPGIYHYSNEGRISWFEFALAIRELIDSPTPVTPIPTEKFPTPAKRPHYSLLDKSHIRDVYGVDVPQWKDSLSVCIGRLGV
jgi:dTDP-4-dehydrorhamnose reductase